MQLHVLADERAGGAAEAGVVLQAGQERVDPAGGRGGLRVAFAQVGGGEAGGLCLVRVPGRPQGQRPQYRGRRAGPYQSYPASHTHAVAPSCQKTPTVVLINV